MTGADKGKEIARKPSKNLPDDAVDPEGENVGFIWNMTTQVSLPRTKPKIPSIQRSDGSMSVTMTPSGGAWAYGKYPRLLVALFSSFIAAKADCVDFERQTIYIDGSFRKFFESLGPSIGGLTYEVIREQLVNFLGMSFVLKQTTEDDDMGVAFTVGRDYHVNWGRDADDYVNYVRFTPEYWTQLTKNSVPVSIAMVKKLSSSVLALDIYLWLTRRYRGLTRRAFVPWSKLEDQFGIGGPSKTASRDFKKAFRKALDRVLAVYDDANVVVGRNGVTLFPSKTSVPTVEDKRLDKLMEKRQRVSREKKVRDEKVEWRTQYTIPYYAAAETFTQDELYEHFQGETDDCPVCRYSKENVKYHGVWK